jgi:hypothetical protein
MGSRRHRALVSARIAANVEQQRVHVRRVDSGERAIDDAGDSLPMADIQSRDTGRWIGQKHERFRWRAHAGQRGIDRHPGKSRVVGEVDVRDAEARLQRVERNHGIEVVSGAGQVTVELREEVTPRRRLHEAWVEDVRRHCVGDCTP